MAYAPAFNPLTGGAPPASTGRPSGSGTYTPKSNALTAAVPIINAPPVSAKYQDYFKSLQPDERQNFLDHLNVSARAGNSRSKDLFNALKGQVNQGGSTKVETAGNPLEKFGGAVGKAFGITDTPISPMDVIKQLPAATGQTGKTIAVQTAQAPARIIGGAIAEATPGKKVTFNAPLIGPGDINAYSTRVQREGWLGGLGGSVGDIAAVLPFTKPLAILSKARDAAAVVKASPGVVKSAAKTAAVLPQDTNAVRSVLAQQLFKGADSNLATLKRVEQAGGTGGQKLLGSGVNAAEVNNSTSVIKGRPGTPATLPMKDEQYMQRFNAISKSYDKQTKAAESMPALKQRVVLQNIEDTHHAALEQLNHEHEFGSPNPGHVPAVPDQTVPSGFIMGHSAQQAGQEALTARGQRAFLHQRIGQIDKIVQDTTTSGSTRSTGELRNLMQERQVAQDVLDGKRSYSHVYSDQVPSGNGGAVYDTVPTGRGSSMEGTAAPIVNPALAKMSEQELLSHAAAKAGPQGRAGGAIGELRNLFNPAPGAEGQIAKNELRAGMGDLAAKRAQMDMANRGEVKYWSKQKPLDNLTFIHNMENGRPHATPELNTKAAAFRDWFNQDHQLAQTLRPDLPYLKNYFTHNGLWKDPKAAERFFESWMNKPSLGGDPGALHGRTMPTLLDGVRAGLEVKETNPQILANANRSALLRAKMAQEFEQKMLARGVGPATSQRLIDRALGRGFKDSSIYQSSRQIGNTLNQAQLSLSGFHVAGTSLNSIFSQAANVINNMARLHPLEAAKGIPQIPVAPLRDVLVYGNKMMGDFKKGKISSDLQNYIDGGGRVVQPNYNATGLARSLTQIQSGTVGGVTKGVLAAPVRALGAVSKPIMEWWVPRMKMGAFKAMVDSKLSALGPNASADAIKAAKAEAVDSIDNRFGQLVQDNLFWDQHIKDMTHLMMRSPGWNIGTVREVGGGAANLLKPKTYMELAKGHGLPENSAYTLSLLGGTMMIGGTMQYMFTGEWPSSLHDYFFPRTGKIDKNGNQERVSLPTYSKDIFAFIHNPVQTAKNKANPFLAEGFQLGANQDYFGNQIRNPKDDVLTQLKQVAGYVGKANLPFSVTNTNQRVEKSPSTAAQSFFGVTPAPAYITKSPFEQKVSDALNLALGNRSLTPEQQALNNTKSTAKQAAQGGDQSLIDQMVQQGKLTKKQGDSLKTSAKGTSLQNTFSYLLSADRQSAADLLKSASPADIRKLGNLGTIRTAMYKSLRVKSSSQALRQASQQILDTIGH